MTLPLLPTRGRWPRLAWLLLWVLGLLPLASHAQLYYLLDDGSASTTLDQPRTVALGGSGDALVRSGVVQSGRSLVLDAANNRLLLADGRANNGKIVALSLASGNVASTFFTPPAIAGASRTTLVGLALDAANRYLYYTLDDGSATTALDQVRRVGLDGTGDVLIKSGAVQAAGPLVLDAASNRLLLADGRLSQASTSQTNARIVAVSLASGNASSTFLVPAAIASAASTQVAGLALDVTNAQLYYTLNDGSATTALDQVRRVGLSGSNDVLLKSGAVQTAGELVLDAANNRLLLADSRANNGKIVALSLASGNAASTFFTPPTIAGAITTALMDLALQQAVAPTVSTGSATSITAASAQLSNSTLGSDGGASLTDYGVVYVQGTNTPTLANPKVQAGTSSPSSFPANFTVNLGGLNAGTTYTARAYATNSQGTTYGATVTFTTQTTPTVTTAAATNVMSSSAVLSGNVTADGGAAVTGRGVVYSVTSTNSTPTIGGSGVTQAANGSGTGSFSATSSGLAPGTSYSVQAYATNSVGTSYGGTQTFTTTATAPTVTTTAAGSITSTSAVLGGSVTATGGATVTGRGVVYSSSNTSPTVGGANTVNAANGSGTGSFSATSSGLTASTTYYVQAYATNSQGTSYGGVQTFTTTAVATATAVTGQTPSPTATAQVSYQVTFSTAVSGLGASNFSLLTTGNISGASVASVNGSGTTYTVVVDTGTGEGTLRLNVDNSTNVMPAIANVPYTSATTYTITRSFAAAPTLRIQGAGSASGNTDVTAFVDVVQVLRGGSAVSNALTNSSFESNNVASGSFLYGGSVVAAPWSFGTQAGVSRNASGFGSTAYAGDAVALLQSTASGNGSVSQNLAVPTGTYQVSLQAAQRNYTSKDQVIKVFVNDVFVGSIQPPSTTAYQTFTSAAFSVTAPELTATVSTTSGSPTSTSPIPFAVSFSQSVGTTLAASDVTVTGGTLNTASFSGSGAGPYTFTVTPSAAGTVTVSLTAGVANDANNTGNTGSNSVSVQFQAPTITVAPATATLPGGTQGTAYSVTFSASGGTGSYDYSVSGSLPAGLSLAASGVLSGTPTASGTFNFTIIARDNSAAPGPYSGSRSYTLSIAAQPVTAAPVVTSPANGSLLNTTTPTYAGTAPAGSTVTVYVDGASSGITTASAGGSFSFVPATALTQGSHTVRATAQSSGSAVSSSSATNNFTVDTVQPSVAISSTAGASGGSTSTSPIPFTVTFSESVTGFAAAKVTVTNGTVASFAGSGATYSLNVTPTTAGTATTVSIAAGVAQDAAGNGNSATAAAYSITFQAPTITVAPASLPGGTVGTAYSQTLTASGGAAPYSYTVTGTLPNGLTLSGNTISGTPTSSGTFNLRITATDNSAAPGPYSGFRDYTLTIAQPTITVTPASLPGGTVGVAYSQALTASGGAGTYSYTVTGTLPTGLSLSGNTLAGTPTASGSFSFVATATDGFGSTGSQAYTVAIAAPTITVTPATATLPGGTQGTAYSVTFSASGGTGSYAYSITSGSLPSGLSLAASGVLSGTPAASGSYNFTVTARDAFGSTGARAYTLTIAAPAVTAVTWTGAVSTDWFSASNWSPAQVPDATIDATIPTSPSGNRFPALSSGTATARNLTLGSGAALTQTGGTLALAANLTNNGTFAATGGTASLGGTAQSNILGSGTIRFWNLTVGASGVQLSTSAGASVQRVLTLNGSFATQSNAFTLESGASGTALVVNNGSAVVSGNVTVQRYLSPAMNPGLGYHHYSAPISTATVASLATASYTPVVNPAYNTSPTPAQVRPFPTVLGYDQSRLATTSNDLDLFTKGWYSPGSVADALTVGQGYAVNSGAGQNLSATGPLNNGTLTQTLARNSGATAADAGLALVGNPYPAPLDWSQVDAADRPGLDGVLYVFQSTSQYGGQYRSYTNGVGGDPLVAQGQGFFVRVTPGQTSGTLTFRNSQRVTSYQNPAVYRPAAETRPLVQLTLQGTGTAYQDDAYVYFEAGATAGLDAQFDAQKLANSTGMNLSTSLPVGTQLSIDGRPALGITQLVVPLAVGVPAPGSYSLRAAQLLNLRQVPTYLRDLQTGAVVDLAQQPSYQFVVGNAGSLLTGRFELVSRLPALPTTNWQVLAGRPAASSYQFVVGNAGSLLTGRFELVFSPQQALASTSAALAQQVALYPNPARHTAFVELPASLGRQVVSATLVDAVGREARTLTLPAQGAVAHSLELRELPTGVYMLHLRTSAGTIVKKLIVE